MQDALTTEPRAKASLGAHAAASQATLKQASELFEEQVVMADTLDAPWPAFYQQASDLMAQTYQLNSATLDFLRLELQQRLGNTVST